MERTTSPKKKLKSPVMDATANINIKTSVTCVNVPDGLFDAAAAKKHFSKFGRVQKIRLFPKKQMCIIEYDQPMSAERAVLNAGAYDGFMFDVTKTKARVRRKSKKDDDPDWVPDSDVEEELSAMSGVPTYRAPRQKPMDVESPIKKVRAVVRSVKSSPRAKIPVRERKPLTMSQPPSGRESPVAVLNTQTSMSMSEAAAELHQLRFRVSLSPDEQWRTLDARDRILRAWGGAGSRVKMGGATIGTCPDMCPEKELLHRQAEHQVMTLETIPDSDGQLEPWRAVKQYSRSSADQEIPMCYELRPAYVLMRTCSYLLHEIADTTRQVNLADWFHFMWDRLRGIRKDITQQALCCAESIRLVEMCARFHAHCSARLADLEHTQFDQKLNTDNLTKCLQTLKHMYADVDPELKPCEAEFRGYIALLNLGDANFWWEIKQLPLDIQKSQSITFAMKVFNALDNNNYVRFFRLVKEQANYLQACILLRYFNDVRARALARIVKAYAPRGGSKYPAEELMNSLSFESVENMKSFISHYGLRFGKDEYELTVILDRNQFIEDSDPYPLSRSRSLIESKRQSTVGEVIAGGMLPEYDYMNHPLYSSFNKDGKLKEAALIAEEQGYNTLNDSNKDVKLLKAEIHKLLQGGRIFGVTEKSTEPRSNFGVKTQTLSPGRPINTFTAQLNNTTVNKSFSFKPAIPVASKDFIKNSPEKIFGNDNKKMFSFSKPQETAGTNMFVVQDTGTVFHVKSSGAFVPKTTRDNGHLLGKSSNETKNALPNPPNIFGTIENPLFRKPDSSNSLFGQPTIGTSNGEVNKNVFTNTTSQNAFGSQNIFNKVKDDKTSIKPSNIFAKAINTHNDSKNPASIFGSFNKPNTSNDSNTLFAKPQQLDSQPKSVFASNGDISPGSLFKSANSTEGKTYSIFQSKNKAQSVADNIFNSVNPVKGSVYEFDQSDTQEEQLKQQRLNEEKVKQEMEKRLQEQMIQEEKRKQELKCQEEERRKEEERKKEEELKMLEKERLKAEKIKKEEQKKKAEELRKAELKIKAEEKEKLFKERVDKESKELTEDLINEVRCETVIEILMEETQKLKSLISYAHTTTEETLMEVCDEMSLAEMKAEKFWTDKLTKKWFHIWKEQFHRNFRRRYLLENTPVWLTDKTPVEAAASLWRGVENATLKNMNAIHRGYKFSGELRQLPSPTPYNIVDIIRSSLLKRMKQINYPYEKCFFWKVTLVSPGEKKWLHRKIEIENWLIDAFSDKKKHDTSETLIRVEKQSWNNLMDFSTSVSLTNPDRKRYYGEAVEGSNGLLFYTTEHDNNLIDLIKETVKQKYPYQVIPVTVVMPQKEDQTMHLIVGQILTSFVDKKIISGFKIFVLDPQNIADSLNASTKSALKWMAKKYPPIPPLEVDCLKSICQRYLGNEIWYRLRSEADMRVQGILKDLRKLVNFYNVAVDKLTEVITNEELFNYTVFPLEFKEYLDHASPYPKTYEFIPTNVRNAENISAIRDLMKKLKLPSPMSEFQPIDVSTMQGQMRKFCNQIGWFEDTEEIICKVVAKLPTQFADLDMPSEQFSHYFEHYDLIDFLNILVYEKINDLQNFDNRYAVYERPVLEEYRNMHWLYEVEVVSNMKHKPLDYNDDDLDMFIEAKRRKIALDSMEYLMLEDNDCTMVEDTMKAFDNNVSQYSNCKEAVKQLEEQIDLERKKSMDLENLLKSALSNV